MPTKNTIVAIVVGTEPLIEKSSAETIKNHPDGILIEFEDKQSAYLLPKDHAATVLDIIEGLRKMRAPVYVEINPDTKEIIRLLIPLVSKITNVIVSETEDTLIDLTMSHARHPLKHANPDFSNLLEALQIARKEDNWVIITETDEDGIIDVQKTKHKLEPTTSGKVVLERGNILRNLLCRWFKWLCCLIRCLRCVSQKKAQEMFDLVSSKTCNPLTVPPPCIPFLYPDDGCWARAHEMCRLMINAGVTPKKVWIDGNLRANTSNHPNCYIRWGWHVAPTVCVRRGFCRIEDMVIDPSLFTGPVSKSTWKGVQGDSNATLTDSDASLYWRNYMPTDPGYADTNYRLQYYRLQLQNRSLQPSGPPPYAHCP